MENFSIFSIASPLDKPFSTTMLIKRMSELIEPRPVKLFVGLIYSEDAPVGECIKRLETVFGEIDFISKQIPFNFTHYYQEEMGNNLSRKIISFKILIRRDGLVNTKIFTNQVEKMFSVEGKRKINIDPGYIAPEHLILSTGKGYYHRPYLGRGVYADLTLVYKNKEFHSLKWTYPDYRTEEIRQLLKSIREKYMLDLGKELES
jgi:hypothetical protein